MSKAKEVQDVEFEEQEIEYRPVLSRIVEFLIVLGIIALISMVQIYVYIWHKEDFYRQESRDRMTALFNAEKFFKTLTGKYSDNPHLVMQVVNAIRDSVTADSTFVGERLLKLPDTQLVVSVPQNFNVMFDTTFALKWEVTDTVIDTSYKVVMYNFDQALYDTIYVLKPDLKKKMNDPYFRGVIDTAYTERILNEIKYRPYFLHDSLAYCPLLKQPYILKTDNGEKIEIRSPIKGKYEKRMFLFFTFSDTSHGAIIDGEKNWERM